MTGETRLLAYLTQRFAPHPEDVATEALAFLLERAPAMRSAFWNAAKALLPALPETVSFRAQVTATGGTRPDLVGFDVTGHEVAMVEAKFWAGLTANQPVAYLERLRVNGRTPSALIVVAPAQRLESLWPELLRLCRISGQYPELHLLPSAHQARVALVDDHVSLVLTSWPYVLEALVERATADGDSAMVSDLLQLRSLADQQDEDAFLPIQAFELGQDFPRRMVLLTSLIDDLVRIAQSEGLVSTEGLRSSGRSTGYGRFVRVAGAGAWIGVSFEYWRRYRPTPLWLQLQAWENDGETLSQKRLRLAPLEEERTLIALPEGPLVALSMPLGAERADVLAALVDQVREIHRLLLPAVE